MTPNCLLKALSLPSYGLNTPRELNSSLKLNKLQSAKISSLHTASNRKCVNWQTKIWFEVTSWLHTSVSKRANKLDWFMHLKRNSHQPNVFNTQFKRIFYFKLISSLTATRKSSLIVKTSCQAYVLSRYSNDLTTNQQQEQSIKFNHVNINSNQTIGINTCSIQSSHSREYLEEHAGTIYRDFYWCLI